MDVRTLQYFAAVVEKGGIQSAADEMYVTRQTVSHAIARLEEELGFRLFDRKNNDLSLTYPGVYFYEDACRVIEAYDAMINRARSYKEGTRTRIVFERAFGFHNELREHLLTFKKDNETWLDLEIYDKHSAAARKISWRAEPMLRLRTLLRRDLSR